MGLFKNMMDKIFRAGANAERPEDAAQPGTRPVSRVEMANQQGVPVSQATPGMAPAGTATQSVDVGAVLDQMAASKGEKLDWKNSIVDLMKVLDMDSSLAARKDLAQDLNYTGDTNDSAAMNMWLHKEVMRRFKENGGRLPADLDAR